MIRIFGGGFRLVVNKRTGMSQKEMRVPFGTEEYHHLVRPLLLEIHEVYAGRRAFFWLNDSPYRPEEEFDWFVAGRAFGGVRRPEHGGQGTWQDMQLAWLEDLHAAWEQHGSYQAVELDGGAIMPAEYMARALRICKGER